MGKQADFYIIGNPVTDAKYKFASRLSNKLQRINKKTLILTNNSDSSDKLDKLLWSFSGTSFVSHERLGSRDIKYCSLHIGEQSQLDDAVLDNKYAVLINLANNILPDYQHFERIAEIIEQDEQQKQLGRQRFETYKSQGYALKTHNIEL